MWGKFTENIKTNSLMICIIIIFALGKYLEVDKDVLLLALTLVGGSGLYYAKDPKKDDNGDDKSQ